MRLSPNSKILGIVAAILFLFLGIGYYGLGGFNAVKLETIRVDNYDLIGLSFKGSYKSDTVKAYFEKMRNILEQGQAKGQIVIMYDQEPVGNRGNTTGFIGIRLTETPSKSLSNLEKRKIHTERSVRVAKDGHISVMPNPDKINSLIKEYVEMNSLKVANINIEIYYPDNRLVIERPILE